MHFSRRRFSSLVISCLIFAGFLFGCGSTDIPAASSTYTVTYNGNGNTSGSVPIDAKSPYHSGATVTVLTNSGTLAKTNNVFLNWNTATDGSGVDYNPADTLTVGSANIVLYAKWGGIVTSGLVLNLDAANASGVTPYAAGTCTGTTWTDLTSNHNDGALTNFSGCGSTEGWNGDGTTTINGTAGPYRLTFNGGSHDYVDLGIPASLQLTTGLSISAWINTTSSNGTIFDYYAQSGAYLGYGLEVGEIGAGNLAYWSSGNGSWVGSNSITVNDGNWHNVVVTYNGTDAVIYEDATQIYSGASNNPGVSIAAALIGSEDGGLAYFTGSIADIMIYNTNLTLAQVQRNCNVLAARFAGASCD